MKALLPINIIVWMLIVLSAATPLIRIPFWVPHFSLIINLGLTVFILFIMLDAMHRIWHLGESSKAAFPNQRLFYAIIGTYFAYFIGQTVLGVEKLTFHIRDGDIIDGDIILQLVPARFVMFGLEFISELVLMGTMSAILNTDESEVKKKNSYHLMKDQYMERTGKVTSANFASDESLSGEISNPTSAEYAPLPDQNQFELKRANLVA